MGYTFLPFLKDTKQTIVTMGRVWFTASSEITKTGLLPACYDPLVGLKSAQNIFHW